MSSPKKLYNFKDRVLFTEALTHTSYCYENPMTGHHNERLEFLGDSIVSCVVTDYIFGRFKKYKEGTLTQLRARIVCQETLAKFALILGLEKKLRLGIGSSNMRNNEKVLCDTFEAYVGAVFLDAEKDLEAVMAHLEPLVKPFVDELVETNACGTDDNDDETIPIEEDVVPVVNPVIPVSHVFEDPIGKLQIWTSRQKEKTLPCYNELDQNGNNFVFEVLINGKVVGRGEGQNKRTAKKQAAADALKNYVDQGPTS